MKEELKKAILEMWKMLPKGFGEICLRGRKEIEVLRSAFYNCKGSISDYEYRVINDLLRWENGGMLCHYDPECENFVKEFAHLNQKKEDDTNDKLDEIEIEVLGYKIKVAAFMADRSSSKSVELRVIDVIAV